MAASSTFLAAMSNARKCVPALHLYCRRFGTSSALNVKTVEVSTQGNKTVIKGVPKQEEKKHVVRTRKTSNECPLCEFQDTLTYRDVLVLQQFLSPDGRILPRHITGMCKTMQWKLENILYQSYSAGLLPNYKPILPVNEKPEEYDKKYKWRKNNVYYEDFSIENPL